MKRGLALLLAAALSLSLAACGEAAKESEKDSASNDTDTTVDEMLEVAEEIDIGTIMVQIDNNQVKAESMYIGNIYKVTGIIDNISSDSTRGNYCTLESEDEKYQFGGDMWVGGFFEVFLPEEDFLNITKGQTITVVVEIIRTDGIVEMKPAYLVTE